MNEIGQNLLADYFYHGTNDYGAKKFFNQKALYHTYFGKKGIWVSSDIDHALSFGLHLFRIDAIKLDARLIDINHDDDGIFYKEPISLIGNALYINDMEWDKDYKRIIAKKKEMTDFINQPIIIPSP